MPRTPLRNLRPELFEDEQNVIDAFTSEHEEDEPAEVSTQGACTDEHPVYFHPRLGQHQKHMDNWLHRVNSDVCNTTCFALVAQVCLLQGALGDNTEDLPDIEQDGEDVPLLQMSPHSLQQHGHGEECDGEDQVDVQGAAGGEDVPRLKLHMPHVLRSLQLHMPHTVRVHRESDCDGVDIDIENDEEDVPLFQLNQSHEVGSDQVDIHRDGDSDDECMLSETADLDHFQI